MPHPDDLPCQDFVELVTGYLEEVLPPDVRERFEAHLRICDDCELHLGQMRLTVRALSRLAAVPITPQTRAQLAAQFSAWRAERGV